MPDLWLRGGEGRGWGGRGWVCTPRARAASAVPVRGFATPRRRSCTALEVLSLLGPPPGWQLDRVQALGPICR